MNPTGPEQPSILRAARELGASSPAVDRSVASRDELLTGLIVAAYDALSVAAEEEEAAAISAGRKPVAMAAHRPGRPHHRGGRRSRIPPRRRRRHRP